MVDFFYNLFEAYLVPPGRRCGQLNLMTRVGQDTSPKLVRSEVVKQIKFERSESLQLSMLLKGFTALRCRQSYASRTYAMTST